MFATNKLKRLSIQQVSPRISPRPKWLFTKVERLIANDLDGYRLGVFLRAKTDAVWCMVKLNRCSLVADLVQ